MADYRILLEALEVRMGLGIHEVERAAPQRVLVTVAIDCVYPAVPDDRIEAVVDYDFLRTGIHQLATSRHFELQEVFCEAIAELALRDPRVRRVEIRSVKADIYPDARIGCEIVRTRS